MRWYRYSVAWFGILAGLSAGGALAQSAAEDTASAQVLGEIIVEGNTRTDRAVILRLIDLEPGDPFSYAVFDRVWDRLEDSGLFAFVDLDREEHDDGRVDLLVTVEEDQTLRYGPYARYSRRHKYVLGGWLRDNNLRGRGEHLEIQALVYRIQALQATWTRPWLAGREGLELRLSAGWEQGDFVWRPFDYRQWEALANLSRSVVGPLTIEVGGGFESFHQDDPEATRNDWLLTVAAVVDSRDNPFYPRQGFYDRIAVDHRLTADGADFTLLSGDARAFLDLPAAAILALHAYGRLTDHSLPPEHGLFWGGPETVRGAPYALIEGEEGYLLSAEIRYPLILMPISPNGENVGFGLHVFADAGDAWFEGRNPARAAQAFGGGAHVNIASWQLRFEAAKERTHDWTFVFMDQFNF